MHDRVGPLRLVDVSGIFRKMINDIYQLQEDVMRTLVDIPKQQIDELAAIGAARKISRAEIIHRAIAAYPMRIAPARKALSVFGKERPKTLFGTNILIDYLNGIDHARDELPRFTDKAISLMTWMEVMLGATNQTEPAIRRFLSSFANLAIGGA